MIPIVAINYNGAKDTLGLIDSLLLSGESFELVLIDNSSSNKEDCDYLLSGLKEKSVSSETIDYCDEKVRFVKRFVISESSLVTFIQSYNNYGFSVGTNIGIRYAISRRNNEYCCILNNDTIVTPHFASKVIREMQLHDLSAAMGTILYYGYDKDYIWSIGGHINWIKGECVHEKKNTVYQKDERRVVLRDFVSGCFTIFKTEDLVKIGLLDESYFFAGEEYQYSYDLVKKGFKIGWVPSSIIYHKSLLERGNGSSHNILDLCWQYNAYMVKLLFINKNKNKLYCFFWHILFKIYISLYIKKRLLSNGFCTKKEFCFFKKKLFQNINETSFTYLDFNCFKEELLGVEGK